MPSGLRDLGAMIIGVVLESSVEGKDDLKTLQLRVVIFVEFTVDMESFGRTKRVH